MVPPLVVPSALALGGTWLLAATGDPSAVPVLRAVAQEEFLLRVLLQLVVILTAARAGGWLATRIGQPVVVGEIATGLLLGPSVVGGLFPDLSAAIFPPDDAMLRQTVSMIGQIGLILLMFLIGLEFEASHLRHVGAVSAGVAVAGIALPMALGGGLAWWMHPYVAEGIDRIGFTLIVGTALSITAIPILGRIMIDLGIQRTRIGTLTMSAAAIDDVLGWVLLAAVTAWVTIGLDPWRIAGMLAASAGFVAAIWLVVRPILKRLIPADGPTDRSRTPAPAVPTAHGAHPRAGLASDPESADIRPRDDDAASANAEAGLVEPPATLSRLSGLALTSVLVLVLLSAIATNAIGIFSVFGPFVLGVFLADQTRLRDAMRTHVGDFVAVFFLPVFFTYTGLNTDAGTLSTPLLWGLAGLVILAASVGKMLGSGLVARLGAFPGGNPAAWP